MNSKIGKSQAILLILIVMINKILLNMPKEIIKQSQTGAPINIIFTGILAILLTLIICKLFKKFPNEDIIEISDYLGKKPLKFIVGIGFELLFALIITTVIYEFSSLLQKVYFPKTPLALILLIFLATIGFANKTGFKAIIKSNTIIVILILISLIVILGGTIKNLNFNRLYPILGQNVKTTFLEGAQNIYAYGGLLYLFFIMPFLKNKKDFTPVAIISILISGLFLLFTAVTLLALFPFISHSEEIMSMYLLTRCIEFGTFLQRTDAIFIFLWIISAFSYLSISLMFMVNIFKKLTNCQDSPNYSYSFLGIIFALIMLFHNQSIFKLLQTVIYKYLILGILILSLIVLILANIKRKDYTKWKKQF